CDAQLEDFAMSCSSPGAWATAIPHIPIVAAGAAPIRMERRCCFIFNPPSAATNRVTPHDDNATHMPDPPPPGSARHGLAVRHPDRPRRRARPRLPLGLARGIRAV